MLQWCLYNTIIKYLGPKNDVLLPRQVTQAETEDEFPLPPVKLQKRTTPAARIKRTNVNKSASCCDVKVVLSEIASKKNIFYSLYSRPYIIYQ